MYQIFEIMTDGKQYFRFETDDKFEAEVWIDHHKYDHSVIRSKSKLIIVSMK